MHSLYNLDSKGKIRVFNIWTSGDSVCISTGLFHGALVEQVKKCKAKNIGKKNATTPEEQAVSEMMSRIQKKKDEGYVEIEGEVTVEKIKNLTPDYPKAMLASTYTSVDWENDEIIASPKLDGMRCLTVIKDNEVRMYSREGKELFIFDHIKQDLLSKFENVDIVLDGELYVHEEPDGWKEEFGYEDFNEGSTRFQSLMKACKKYYPDITEQVEYWVYDAISSEPFEKRYYSFNHAFCDTIKVVFQTKLEDEEDLQEFLKECLDKGFEGVMLRKSLNPYEGGKRSKNLIKVKEFFDEEFEVIDIVPADARPTWGMPVCTTKDGKTFTATFKGTVEEKEELLTNKHKYIGSELTVKYFEKSSDGLPRFPVALRFKNYL